LHTRQANKFEHHAINAALDLREALADAARTKAELDELKNSL
jgi:hypothetical protein